MRGATPTWITIKYKTIKTLTTWKSTSYLLAAQTIVFGLARITSMIVNTLPMIWKSIYKNYPCHPNMFVVLAVPFATSWQFAAAVHHTPLQHLDKDMS